MTIVYNYILELGINTMRKCLNYNYSPKLETQEPNCKKKGKP